MSLIGAFLFSCSNDNLDKKDTTGDIKLNISVGGVTSPDAKAIVKNQAEETETIVADFDGHNKMTCTLRKVYDPESITRATTNPVQKNVYYRVLAYSGNNSSSVNTTPAADVTFQVGKESEKQMKLSNTGSYYFVAYSYNTKEESDMSSTNDNFTPGIGNYTLNNVHTNTYSPKDVLLFAQAQNIQAGDNNLNITFKHAYSLVNITMNMSGFTSGSSSAANITSCSASISPGYTSSVSLMDLNATALSSTSGSRTVSWPTGVLNANQTSIRSDSTILFANNNAPTVTFPVGSIQVKMSDGTTTLKNTNAISFPFTTTLEAGYKYELTCTINSSSEFGDVVVYCMGDNAGVYPNSYNLAYDITSGNDFSSIKPSTARLAIEKYFNGRANITWKGDLTSDVREANSKRWLTGNDGTNSGLPVADLVVVGIGSFKDSGGSLNTTYVTRLVNYINNGGTVLMFSDPGTTTGTQNGLVFCTEVLKQVLSSTSVAYISPGNISSPIIQMTSSVSDSITNGSAGGDVRGAYFGVDCNKSITSNAAAGGVSLIGGLPSVSYITKYAGHQMVTNTTGSTISTNASTNISTYNNNTIYSQYTSMFKIENGSQNVFFCGDGGFFATTDDEYQAYYTSNTTPTWNSAAYSGNPYGCGQPCWWDRDLKPAATRKYWSSYALNSGTTYDKIGGNTYVQSLSNSKIFMNAFVWAMHRQKANYAVRKAYFGF